VTSETCGDLDFGNSLPTTRVAGASQKLDGPVGTAAGGYPGWAMAREARPRPAAPARPVTSRRPWSPRACGPERSSSRPSRRFSPGSRSLAWLRGSACLADEVCERARRPRSSVMINACSGAARKVAQAPHPRGSAALLPSSHALRSEPIWPASCAADPRNHGARATSWAAPPKMNAPGRGTPGRPGPERLIDSGHGAEAVSRRSGNHGAGDAPGLWWRNDRR
jgi:hypothetical protein